MPSENIYAQFAPAPRSFTDYANELDQREMGGLKLEGQRRQNMLAGLLQQQQMGDMQNKQRSQNLIRQVYAGLPAGAPVESLLQGLRATGDQGAIERAAAEEKAWLERRNTESQIGERGVKADAEKQKTSEAKRQAAILKAASFTGPDDAIATLNQSVANGEVPMQYATLLMKTIPRDPAAFREWQLRMVAGVADPAKMVELLKPQIQTNNTGGFTVTQAIDPITGKPTVTGQIKNTQSPDNAATVGATIRGQNLTDARARETNDLQRSAQRTQIVETPNGPMLVDKGSGQGRPVMAGGVAVPGDSAMKREGGARRVLSLLADAKALVPAATGSYAGAAVDSAARVVGAAPGGAQAIAKLKALEGAILAEMPRMEGPQSNADVTMYKQAAGELGDPTAPREVKLAAIDTIEKIQSRYAGAQSQAAPSAGPARVASDADYNALPSGATFIGPDGKTRRKP